jgi:hypothetical protein
MDFTHTVFGELSTATWCPYCRYAHAALKNIYNNGEYPFYYVSFVFDKNADATERLEEYNVYYIPFVAFDGGYDVYVGGESGGVTQDAYNSSIVASGARQVMRLETNLSVIWLGDATLDIKATVQNDEALGYEGRIRVYVTEISSERGWRDTGGVPYTFAFLDYAFNEDIHIDGGDIWQKSTTWNGYEHADGYGNDFGNITQDNIMVIAAVFNAERHQGYAVPPDESPFDAYYVDDVVATAPVQDDTPPTLEITHPKEGYLHMFDREIIPLGVTLVIGDITVGVEAEDEETGIGTVEFYVDDILKHTASSSPFEWLWAETAFLRHTIKTIAYNNAGNMASDEQVVWILNL